MVPQFWYEATRHEDSISSGIADVSFVQKVLSGSRWNLGEARHGWMELKHKSMKPVRDKTIVRLPHYTDEQRAFLMAKGKAGMSFLFLQLERDYLLFDHESAQQVGKVNTADLYDLAVYVSKGKLDGAELHNAIHTFG